MLRHLGIDEAGTDRIARDAGTFDLRGDTLCQADHGMLRRGVCGDIPPARESRDRCDIHDRAPFALEHEGEERTRTEKRTCGVHRQHAIPVVERGLRQRRTVRDAGVVNQDVDRPGLLYGSLGEIRDTRRVGHVAGQRPRPAATAADLDRHALDAIEMACSHDDCGALRRQRVGDRGADSLAAAGHDGDRAVKSPHAPPPRGSRPELR